MTTLYDKYGGMATVEKCVSYFYDECVLKDDTVNFFFKDTDMDSQKIMQSSFISYALGGPVEYKGKDMKKVHTGMGITNEQYDTIVRHLATSLKYHGVTDEDIAAVAAKLEPLRAHIVGV